MTETAAAGRSASEIHAPRRMGPRTTAFVSNRCLLLGLLLVCIGAGLFYAHEEEEEEEAMVDDNVAWKLATDHVLPYDAAPAKLASPFAEESSLHYQHPPSPEGDRGRKQKGVAGGATVAMNREPIRWGKRAMEWKEAAGPPGSVKSKGMSNMTDAGTPRGGSSTGQVGGKETEEQVLEREMQEIQELKSHLAAAKAVGGSSMSGERGFEGEYLICHSRLCEELHNFSCYIF